MLRLFLFLLRRCHATCFGCCCIFIQIAVASLALSAVLRMLLHPDIKKNDDLMMHQWRLAKGQQNPTKVLANIVKAARAQW